MTHPRAADLGVSAKQEAGDVLRIAVEIDHNWLVGCEQAGEGVLVQSVWMSAGFAEDKKIVDIDDSDSDT